MSAFGSCSLRANCKCKGCKTAAPDVAASSYRGNQPKKLTAEQKKAADAKVAELSSLSAMELQAKEQAIFGGVLAPISDRNARSKARAVTRIAEAEATGYVAPMKSLMQQAAFTSAALLGAGKSDIATTKDLLQRVAEQTLKDGPLFVPKRNLDPAQLKEAETDRAVLRSAVDTRDARVAACDQHSVWNPAQAKYAPDQVQSKRLECANNTYGQCMPKDGGALYPFSCEPTFEMCMAGNAEACAIISKQVTAGVNLDAVQQMHKATTPVVTAKDGDALKVLHALDEVWGHKSTFTMPGRQSEYDILVLALLMDRATLERMQKEHKEAGSFDQKNRLLVDKVWDAVQVPLIKLINAANKNPATYDANIRKLLKADAVYATLMQATDAQLQKAMFDLADSTDLMQRYLYVNSYVDGSSIKIGKPRQIAFLLGVYLMKRFLFRGIQGVSFV